MYPTPPTRPDLGYGPPGVYDEMYNNARFISKCLSAALLLTLLVGLDKELGIGKSLFNYLSKLPIMPPRSVSEEREALAQQAVKEQRPLPTNEANLADIILLILSFVALYWVFVLQTWFIGVFSMLSLICAFAFLHDDWRPILKPIIKLFLLYLVVVFCFFVFMMYSEGVIFYYDIPDRKTLRHAKIIDILDKKLRAITWDTLEAAFVFPYTYVRKIIPYMIVMFND